MVLLGYDDSFCIGVYHFYSQLPIIRTLISQLSFNIKEHSLNIV